MPGIRGVLVDQLLACKKCTLATTEHIADILKRSGRLSDDQVQKLVEYLMKIHPKH